jgi:hypothetical protein
MIMANRMDVALEMTVVRGMTVEMANVSDL